MCRMSSHLCVKFSKILRISLEYVENTTCSAMILVKQIIVALCGLSSNGAKWRFMARCDEIWRNLAICGELSDHLNFLKFQIYNKIFLNFYTFTLNFISV